MVVIHYRDSVIFVFFHEVGHLFYAGINVHKINLGEGSLYQEVLGVSQHHTSEICAADKAVILIYYIYKLHRFGFKNTLFNLGQHGFNGRILQESHIFRSHQPAGGVIGITQKLR